MPNNKWTKTATSASLAILGVTQLNNKADAKIVLGGSNVTQNGVGAQIWSLDSVSGYGAKGRASVAIRANGSHTAFVKKSAIGNPYFATMAYGAAVSMVALNLAGVLLTGGKGALPSQQGFFGFKDVTSGTPIYGWAHWTTTTNNTLTLDE
jgi:hypothetical protein